MADNNFFFFFLKAVIKAKILQIKLQPPIGGDNV